MIGGGASTGTKDDVLTVFVGEIQPLPEASHDAPVASSVRVEKQESEIVTQDDRGSPRLATVRGRAAPMGCRSPTAIGPRGVIL